jgi:hypothetical protein
MRPTEKWNGLREMASHPRMAQVDGAAQIHHRCRLVLRLILSTVSLNVTGCGVCGMHALSETCQPKSGRGRFGSSNIRMGSCQVLGYPISQDMNAVHFDSLVADFGRPAVSRAHVGWNEPMCVLFN